jgi:hypothetical protein
MGRYLGIKKYKVTDEVVYYQIEPVDFPEIKNFFIGVDKKHSIISFFQHEPFDKAPDYVLDLKDMDRKINIEWLPPRIPYQIISMVKEALQQESLPNDISYA